GDTPGGRPREAALTGDFDPLLRAISGHYVVNLDVQEPSLEEVFLAYYDDAQDQPAAQATHGPERQTIRR
ncbi:hypothetical protein HC928_20095, partial [bacterium]|nr:hypothetical protein [bacterium]